MNILEQLQAIIEPLDIPVETGIFTNPAPPQYVVIVPLIETFEMDADDMPLAETQEARLSIFSKSNYIALKNRIVRAVLAAGLTVTARQFIEYESDTGYYHYNVDVAHYYDLETEDIYGNSRT